MRAKLTVVAVLILLASALGIFASLHIVEDTPVSREKSLGRVMARLERDTYAYEQFLEFKQVVCLNFLIHGSVDLKGYTDWMARLGYPLFDLTHHRVLEKHISIEMETDIASASQALWEESDHFLESGSYAGYGHEHIVCALVSRNNDVNRMKYSVLVSSSDIYDLQSPGRSWTIMQKPASELFRRWQYDGWLK